LIAACQDTQTNSSASTRTAPRSTQRNSQRTGENRRGARAALVLDVLLARATLHHSHDRPALVKPPPQTNRPL
jgi:hypothetical protein